MGFPPDELFADSETEFWSKLGSQATFVLDEQGQVTGFREHSERPRYAYIWPRVDASAAQQIMANVKARIRSQTPTPGGEAALRRMIDGVRAGRPNYDEMAPWFADLVRETVSLYQSIYASWGAVQSVEFRHVDDLGRDVYEVRQERGKSTWSIVLDSDGLIADADNIRGL
jgi:hypothetical protein